MANIYITNDAALLQAGTYTAPNGTVYTTQNSTTTTINVSGNDSYLIDKDVSGTTFTFRPATTTTTGAAPTITVESGSTGSGDIVFAENGTGNYLSPTVNVQDGVNALGKIISLSYTNSATINVGDDDGDGQGATIQGIQNSTSATTPTLNVTDNSIIAGNIDVSSAPAGATINLGDNTQVYGTITGSNQKDTLVIGDGVKVGFGGNGNSPGGSIVTFGGQDSVTVGRELQVAGSTGINSGLDTDTLRLVDGAYYYLSGSTPVYITETTPLANFASKQLYYNDSTGARKTAFIPRTFENFDAMPCFARGTLIETDRGVVVIEDLTEGDLVLTRDNGSQPIRWIGSKSLSPASLINAEKLRPIRIRRHALGNNIPSSDLLVSPQHRVLVRSKIAQKMFGTDEVLVAAKQLCQVDGIDLADDITEVEYFHILFDRHEVVISNGAETESLYTGPEALKSVGPAALEEIFALFPELKDLDYFPTPARQLATGRMGRKLAVRHQQNHKALVS